MARGRSRARGSQRQLNKAVNPNIAMMAAGAPRGLDPVPRKGFALMDAINMATGNGQFDALPRDPFNTTAFGPMDPLVPDPIDGVGPDGRSRPRTWEYTVGWNLPGSGNREVPWQVLRAASVGVGIIRRCIEVRKKHVRALDWSFAPTQRAITELYEKDPGSGKLEAERQLRERLMPEIRRLEEYWEHPWQGNDLSFGQWGNAVIDDYLTFDAVVVYPQTSFGGEVLNLQLIDPATIKLLLDSYGNRPGSPHPAFQQILYGFPRGEWAASVTQDAEGNEVIENGFAASELFYYRENYRTSSPYGLSAVEQALIDSRLYLKRQQWMIAEYDDGSTPLTFLETPIPTDGGEFLTLTQARQWMAALNAKNAGNTSERMRMKPLPNGWVPHPLPGVDERYRPEYDLFLIKLLCSYFGVPASELGFSENSGLGGKGWSEGQADVSGRVGQRPDTAVIGDVVNSLSRQFLRMPKEIAFGFTDPTGVNDAETAGIAKGQIESGQITINDSRDALGKARLAFPEADMPFILGGPSGIIFLEGAKAAADAAVQQAQITAESTALGTAGKLEMDKARLHDGKQARQAQHSLTRETRDLTLNAQAQAQQSKTNKSADLFTKHSEELTAFRNWRRKNREPKRPFVFKYVTPDMGDGLAELNPMYADFGPGYVWVEEAYELEKRASSGLTWLDWNARNPTRPKDAKGRWVKVGSLINALEAEGEHSVARARQQRIDAVRAAGAPVMKLYHDTGAAGLPGDIGKLNEADRRLKRAGGRLFGMPETVHKFDPKLHKPLDTVGPSGKVVVVKPGLRWNEEDIVLEPAHVMPFDDSEQAIADFWKEQEIDVHQLMKEREHSWTVLGAPSTVGPVSEIPSQYLKPKDIRPGMSVDRATLLSPGIGLGAGISAPQGGKPEWVTVGRVVNTRPRGAPGMASFATGQYLVLDESGEPIGRMSANTKGKVRGITKAADADPKAPEPVPVPPDQRWPGWLVDMAIAGLVSAELLAAMTAVMSGPAISTLISDFLEWAGDPAKVTRSPAMIEEWLRLRAPSLEVRIAEAIAGPVRAAHLEGGYVGQESAKAVLESGLDLLGMSPDDAAAVRLSVNWGDWAPGHPEAAQLLLEPGGLGRLLDESNVIIKGIARNRLDEVGKVLGQGLREGLSPKQIGVRLRELGMNETWAKLTALTETNRAQSAAAVMQYREAGQLEKGWMTAHDQRVCKKCHHNAYELDGSERIIAIDARFPSGDLYPPGHPRCRCAPIPIIRRPVRSGPGR